MQMPRAGLRAVTRFLLTVSSGSVRGLLFSPVLSRGWPASRRSLRNWGKPWADVMRIPEAGSGNLGKWVLRRAAHPGCSRPGEEAAADRRPPGPGQPLGENTGLHQDLLANIAGGQCEAACSLSPLKVASAVSDTGSHTPHALAAAEGRSTQWALRPCLPARIVLIIPFKGTLY